MKKIILTLMFCAFLSGCQSQMKDDTSYTPAVNAANRGQPTKIVPVPMPGQLMPLKGFKSPNRLEGEAAIKAANKKAERQPSSTAYINSIMTFDYMPGALYQIYSAPLSVTDIQFQNNEHIVAVGAGDTTRWQVNRTYSGIGANRQEHLLIKPHEEDLTNSLVITTDMRTYHLMLRSTPKTYMASVTWRYPTSDGILTDIEDESGEDYTDIPSGLDINMMTFNYKVKLIKGPSPNWLPKVVFTDGNKTYIKFSNKAQEAPMLFIGDKKSNRITNFRVQGNYYIVDQVIDKGLLHDNRSVVQITSTKK